ncbi:putative cation-transporting ATPase 1 [Hypoxylon texense]
MDAPRPRGIVVFGGGTATNSLVDVFESIRESRNCHLSYVIPISDNGGSSSELIRVFGGPGRLVRLIPGSDTDTERASIKDLFNHRLSSDPLQARLQWLEIVEGRDELWTNISSEKRELIRSVFNLVNLEIVKRARPSSVFNFSKASIGNLFLTGARVFTGSLESAIYLLSTICGIPPTVSTLPVINTNFTHHISAGLADGTQITGQNSISHPSAPTSLPDDSALGNGGDSEVEEHDRIEDATLPGSLPTLRKPYIDFNKTTTTTAAAANPAGSSSTAATNPAAAAADDDLPARIERIWYINPYGHEIFPPANAKVLSAIRAARAVVYSVGSLYTSIVPSLVPRGVGAALSAADGNGPRFKVLILNSANDRETGPRAAPLAATDFVRAVARAAAGSGSGGSSGRGGNSGSNSRRGDHHHVVVTDDDRRDEDAEAEVVRRYVTHLVYLEGEGAPRVDRDELTALGVDCIRVYGRRVDGMLRYDEAGLTRALEAVIGKPEMLRSRRNTSGQ